MCLCIRLMIINPMQRGLSRLGGVFGSSGIVCQRGTGMGADLGRCNRSKHRQVLWWNWSSKFLKRAIFNYVLSLYFLMQPFNAGQSVRAMVCKLQPTLRNASAAAPHTCERARAVPHFNVNTCTRTRAQPPPPYNKCKAKRFTTAKAAATKLFVIQNQNSIDTTHTICREECEDRSADATPCVGTCHGMIDTIHSFIQMI